MVSRSDARRSSTDRARKSDVAAAISAQILLCALRRSACVFPYGTHEFHADLELRVSEMVRLYGAEERACYDDGRDSMQTTYRVPSE